MTVPAATIQAARDNMRRLLDETFQGTVTFDPITVEPMTDYYGEDNLRIVVVYDGDYDLLDPNKLNGIFSELNDVLCDMGFTNVPMESYISKDEYPEWLWMSNHPRPWELE